MSTCRGCSSNRLRPVLDLGCLPAADHFPVAGVPVSCDESAHPLRMDLCAECGLAQLAEDDTETEDPRGIEPLALRDQAAAAVLRLADGGWLRGTTVREFGSPHGGSWLSLLGERGFVQAERADVVLDCFGIMHDADQSAAFRLRREATAPDGVLLLQFHSLYTIVTQSQWQSLRHGHFAYYSLTSLCRQLEAIGMTAVASWEFDLYGGTVLVAAVHGRAEPDACTEEILAREAHCGITEPGVIARLQRDAETQAAGLRAWLRAAKSARRSVYAYGASSRAVALFSLAGVDRGLVAAVADASPAKQGRRMPGTDIEIISPETLVAAEPDDVLLTLPDIYREVCSSYPRLEGLVRVDPSRDAAMSTEAVH